MCFLNYIVHVHIFICFFVQVSPANRSQGSRETSYSFSHVAKENKLTIDSYNARRDRLANKRKSLLERKQPDSESHDLVTSSSSSSDSLHNVEDTIKHVSDSNSSQNNVSSRRHSSDNERKKSVEHVRIKDSMEYSETTTDESVKDDNNFSSCSKSSDIGSNTGIDNKNLITELSSMNEAFDNKIDGNKIQKTRSSLSNTGIDNRNLITELSFKNEAFDNKIDGNKIQKRRSSLLETRRSSSGTVNDFTLTPELNRRRGSLNIRKKSDVDDADLKNDKPSLRAHAENEANLEEISTSKYSNKDDSVIDKQKVLSQKMDLPDKTYLESGKEFTHESNSTTRFLDEDGNNNNNVGETCENLHEISHTDKNIQHSLETQMTKVENRIKVKDDIKPKPLASNHYQKEKLLAVLRAIDEGKDPIGSENHSNVTSNPSSATNISLPFVEPLKILDPQRISRNRDTGINRVKSKIEIMQELFGETSVDHKT